jgi:folate-dependent phosphoribosylglycinamide formyltransferase PurN
LSSRLGNFLEKNKKIVLSELRLFLITSEDPLDSVKIIGPFLKAYKKSIAGVAFIEGLFSFRRVIWGPLYYGPINYLKLIITVLFRFFVGGKVENACTENGFEVMRIKRLNDPQFLEYLKNEGVNLIVSVNCHKIFKGQILSIPERGIINLHYSLLPQYGGLMPIFHALADDRRLVGVTVHYVDESIDTGPIIAQEVVNVERFDTLFSVWRKASAKGYSVLSLAIERVMDGGFIPYPNGPEGRSYFSYPNLHRIVCYYRNVFRRFIGN